MIGIYKSNALNKEYSSFFTYRQSRTSRNLDNASGKISMPRIMRVSRSLLEGGIVALGTAAQSF
jgi:hypothetical protein